MGGLLGAIGSGASSLLGAVGGVLGNASSGVLGALNPFNTGGLVNSIGGAALQFAGKNPYLTGAGILAGMGALGQARNRPKNINFDFRFQDAEGNIKDPAMSTYNPNSSLQSNMRSLRGLGGEFSQAYRNMLNPASAFNQRQFQTLRRNISGQAAQSINQMNAAMAARGMMGIGGAYDAIANRQAGDQFAQGQGNILNIGANLAGQFGGMSMQAYNNAGSLANQIDSRTLSNQQFNVQNQNTYDQYLRQSLYNQMVQNQNAQASYRNASNQNFFNLAGAVLGAKPLPPMQPQQPPIK